MNHSKHVFPEAVKAKIPGFIETNPMISAITALGFFSVLVFNAIVFAIIPYSIILYPLIAVLSVRSLRALENLGGHEGSHWNWTRKHRKLNDILADSFAGWWVLTSAQSFRKTHFVHHGRFGAPPDPCFSRYSMFHLMGERNRGAKELAKAVLREYVPYLADYWGTVLRDNRRLILVSLALHTALCMVVSLFIPGFGLGWCIAVVIPFFFFLPAMRMWAEAEEHDYDGRSEFEDTYNNLGWLSRNLVHPAGDAFHLLHHTLPTIPHFRMAQVHRILMAEDLGYRNAQRVR